MAPFAAAIPALMAGMGATGAAASTAGALATTGLVAEGGASAITAAAAPSFLGTLFGSGVAGASTAATTAGSGLSSLATGLSLGGSVLGAVGSVMQGNTQADLLERNADTLRQQGKMAIESAKQETLKLSTERRKTLGTQSAMYGGAGVSMSGSPLDVMSDTAANFEKDINMTGYNADVTQRAYADQANLYDWQAGRSKTSGWMNAGTTLLTGFGRSLLNRYS